MLAESLMVGTDYRPAHPGLVHPESLLTELHALGKLRDAASLARRGEAELRLGKVRAARASFEAACAADGKHFAGYRGLGAVLDFETLELWERVAKLPTLSVPAGLTDVMADWPALTEQERALVTASAHPFGTRMTQS